MKKRLLIVVVLLFVFLGCASSAISRSGPYELTREHGGRYYCVGNLCIDTEEDDCDEGR